MRYDFGKVYKEIRESKGLPKKRSAEMSFQELAYQRLKVAR